MDDGDDRSANWNCLLKVRITEQPGRQAGTESRPRVRARDREQQGQHLGPARDPNEADSRAGTSMGAKMPRNGQPGKTNRMRCVPPPYPGLQSRILLVKVLLLLLPLTAGNSLSVFIASIKMDTSHLQAGNELDSTFVSVFISFYVSVFVSHCGLALKLGKYCT